MKLSNKFLYPAMLCACLIYLGSCDDDDDEPTNIDVSSITANDIDLNTATSPNNVPTDATITVEFTTNVDPATANNSNITLTRQYDVANVPVSVTASGQTVTIEPDEPLNPGALFTLTISSGLTSAQGVAFTPLARTFTTAGTFAPAGAIAYWTFEENANDVVDGYDANAVVNINYVDSHNEAAGLAAEFNGANSIIEIPNGDQLMETDDFTLSFWAKPVSENKTSGHFVIGLGAFFGFQFEIAADYTSVKMPVQFSLDDGTTRTGGDLFFNGEGNTRDNGGWQGTVVSKDLTGSGGVANLVQDKWAHFVYVFDSQEKTRSLYINGELMQRDNFNLWPDDAAERTINGLQYAGVEPEVMPVLTFGFVHSRAGTLWDTEPWGNYDSPDANHFKGLLDDVIIYHRVITEDEIELMYNSGS